MARKIIRIGSSAGITIPVNILKEMGLKRGDQVTLEMDPGKGGIVVRAARAKTKDARRERIAALTHNFITRYRRDLEELARK